MKLRYLATHAPKLRLWQASGGQDVCGFGRDWGREAIREVSHLSDSKAFQELLHTNHLILGDLVERILDAAGAPLLLDDLAGLVAEWSGIKEARIYSLDEDLRERAHPAEVTDCKPSSEDHLKAKEYIHRLWKEICDLPLEHRRALLLNLSDSAGGDIQLFDFLGIATIQRIAEALQIDSLAFAELWKKLPLDDATIGRDFGLSRQDVVNRRSSARKRLARRMREFEHGI
jgi:hypothetical protein